MLIDFHAHTSGFSRCCRANADEVLLAAKSRGIDGIILTNHYKRSYSTDGDYDALAMRYIEEHRHTESLAGKYGVRVFFGIEVTMDFDVDVHMLVYGVDENFLIQNPRIFEYDIKKLYETVHSAGGALVQGHPMRHAKNRLQDLAYLDGIEINSHPHYEATHIDALTKIAYESGLIITSGGDYHADTARPRCGVYLDDDFDMSKLASFIKNTDEVLIAVQEVGEECSYDYLFERKTANN